jgi:hypothetical protein
MATVPGALLPIPLALSVIVLLITGLPATEAVPIPLAALMAYFSPTVWVCLAGKNSSRGSNESSLWKERSDRLM